MRASYPNHLDYLGSTHLTNSQTNPYPRHTHTTHNHGLLHAHTLHSKPQPHPRIAQPATCALRARIDTYTPVATHQTNAYQLKKVCQRACPVYSRQHTNPAELEMNTNLPAAPWEAGWRDRRDSWVRGWVGGWNHESPNTLECHTLDFSPCTCRRAHAQISCLRPTNPLVNHPPLTSTKSRRGPSVCRIVLGRPGRRRHQPTDRTSSWTTR